MKKIRSVVSVLMCVLLLTAASERGMAADGLSKVVSIPNKDKCTNFGTLATDGSNLYCLKTNSSDDKSALFKYSGGVPKHVKTIANLGHGNGMEYYEKYLYVAAGEKIVKLSTSGAVINTYGMKEKVTAITHYKDNKFILKLPNTTGYLTYAFATLSNDNFTVDLKSKFYVSFKESGTWDPQDIYYNADNDELLIPISKKKDGSATCENIIKSVKLGEVSKGEHFDFYGEFEMNKVGSGYDFFEVESICKSDSGFFIAANVQKTDSGGKTGLDAIYKWGRK